MPWTRYGECNGCGHCCEMFTRDVVVRNIDAEYDPAFYRARGFQPMTISGHTRHVLLGWMAAPCPEHTPTGCKVYDTRPKTCQTFPRVPADIVGSPCSYWFEDGTRKVGGTGSPHPSTLTELIAIETESAHGLHD
jgi:Fe-S-cluster containining protein